MPLESDARIYEFLASCNNDVETAKFLLHSTLSFGKGNNLLLLFFLSFFLSFFLFFFFSFCVFCFFFPFPVLEQKRLLRRAKFFHVVFLYRLCAHKNHSRSSCIISCTTRRPRAKTRHGLLDVRCV